MHDEDFQESSGLKQSDSVLQYSSSCIVQYEFSYMAQFEYENWNLLYVTNDLPVEKSGEEMDIGSSFYLAFF